MVLLISVAITITKVSIEDFYNTLTNYSQNNYSNVSAASCIGQEGVFNITS